MEHTAKIEAIKNINTEEIDFLSPKQKEVAGYIKQNYSVKDICEKMNCSRQNVHRILNQIIGPPNNRARNTRSASNSRGNINYEKYRRCDLSILSAKEKQAINIVIENPEIKHSDIANIMGISCGHATTLLFTARKKLDGEYEIIKAKNRKITAQWIANNQKRVSDTHREWYQKNTELIKSYNKEYYQKNKDKILDRKKAREQTSKEGKTHDQRI